MSSDSVKHVKLSSITGYAFEEGNQRGFPWSNLKEGYVLFASELRQPVEPAEGEEAEPPDTRKVLTEMVLGEKADVNSWKKFCSLFRNHEQETWALGMSVMEHDIHNPIHVVKSENGNLIVTGAHRFVGALIRFAMQKVADNPTPTDTVRVIFDEETNKERLRDISNIENIQRREIKKSQMARVAYEYHLRDISDAEIATRLGLPNGRQKVYQYRRVYEFVKENDKLHLLDKWDAGEATLEKLLAMATGKKKDANVEKKKTRERMLPYASAYDIYNNDEQLTALNDGKNYDLEAVRFGMRIAMGCSDKAKPTVVKPKAVKKAKAEEVKKAEEPESPTAESQVA